MAERICGENVYGPKYLFNYRLFITDFILKDLYEASDLFFFFWPVSGSYTTRYEISGKVNYLITNGFIEICSGRFKGKCQEK